MSVRQANRLIQATSPYLLQHAHNPVAWQPWDGQALEQARREDKPIFLSIGYNACHWCHVMERESFEDEAVARMLNGHFVAIKVDREERPDLDEIYMTAVQAIAGRGGWPMSVWLTPELKPFFGGTYYPPTARFGQPGFLQLLEGIRRAWKERRAELEGDAGRLLEAMGRLAQGEPGVADPGAEAFDLALDQLGRSFDARWGGFGQAPKFPQTPALDLLLRRGTAGHRAMVVRTLDAMWEGGLFDHLGGGFARYSIDEKWLVPHFEKMLTDNALLATSYLAAFQVTGDERYGRIARETLDYLLRDLRDAGGGFHSSEDADSEGEEGRFYVFTPGQVTAALGPEAGPRFCAAFGVTPGGNFEHGASVLHRFDAAAGSGLADEADLRERLRQYRDQRQRPAKDDKVLAAWNGLALTAFARGAQVLGEARYLEAATALAGFLQGALWRSGTLLRTWRQGQAHTPGFLEDYGAVANGLVDLYEAGFDPAWLQWAESLGLALLERFEDRDQGGFYAAATGTADLLLRLKPLHDGALPSGNTLAAEALLRLSWHLERPEFRDSAERTLRWAGSLLEQSPTGSLGLLAVLDQARSTPVVLTLTGRREDPRTQALAAAAHRAWLPNRVLSLAAGDPPTARVCRNQTCSAPVAEPAALAVLLNN